MSRVEIDAAGQQDMPFLLEMIGLSLKTLPQFASKSAVEIQGLARLELLEWEGERSYAFIARSNAQPVGAVWLKAHGEATARQYTLGIAVNPAQQRKGIGTQLMKYVLDYCTRNNGSIITLKVHPGNLPAMRLYRHFEFEEITLEMRKKLQ
jgi:ribosomal protein S18 acetylase RimI-like enzyme